VTLPGKELVLRSSFCGLSIVKLSQKLSCQLNSVPDTHRHDYAASVNVTFVP
jgi:hypothetical protein